MRKSAYFYLPNYQILTILAVLYIFSLPSPGSSQSTPHWWTNNGTLEMGKHHLFHLAARDTPIIAITPIRPDSTYPVLRVEWGFQLSNWDKTSSQLFVLIGSDSMNVIRLWGGGYDAHQQALLWGVLSAADTTPFLQIHPLAQKSVTIIPLQHQLYIKWILSANGDSTIEINGVPLKTPIPILPWHVTHVGIFIVHSTVTFPAPQVHWEL